MILSQNVYTIMYMYVEEERFCVLKAGWTVVLFNWTAFWSRWVSYNAFRPRFSNAKAALLLYERVVSAIRGYQRKLGLDVEENFVVGDSRVWKCIGKGNVKDIYACLVANGDTPKCVDRWILDKRIF